MSEHAPHPTFVEMGGELQARPPYIAEDNLIYAFIFQAGEREGNGQALLDALCKPLNSLPNAKRRYSALGEQFGVVCADIPVLKSKDPVANPDGSIDEKNFAFVIPLKSTSVEDGSDYIAFYMPYVFVDNHFSLITGREVLGYQKGLGVIEMPTDVSEPLLFSLETVGLATHSPDSRSEEHPLATLRDISRAPEATDGLVSFFERVSDALRFGAESIADILLDEDISFSSNLDDLYAVLAGKPAPLVFLKQFRDAAVSDCACYQAILEMTTKVDQQEFGVIAGDLELKVKDLASHPIARDLGIPEEGLKAKIGLWIRGGFESYPSEIIGERFKPSHGA